MAAHSHHHLSIIEAVETLTHIADLEFDHQIGIAQKHELLLSNEKIVYKTVHWLHQTDAASTVNLVRETFRVILYYLKQFYKKEYDQITDPKALEAIKTIMVLVGEAAKKLDKYTDIFHQSQSVKEFKEYKQLQEFYRSKIALKIEEGVLSKWILGLTFKKPSKPLKAAPNKTDRVIDTKHVFVDLESVKKDTEYELFFIRKEDGSRFFSPRLLRNIKLVCDFGYYFGERKELDPLEQINYWRDRVLHGCAKDILKTIGARLESFFHRTGKIKDQKLVEILHKALLALMLSSHTHNLLRHSPIKSCTEYFEDFQKFLREVLQTPLYQKWKAYPSKENNQSAFELIDLVHTLCQALYVNLQGLEYIKPIIQDLIQKAVSQVSKEHEAEVQVTKKVWNHLASDYAAMIKLLKHHPNGPLFKVLDFLKENSFHAFDSILQHNLPNQLFDLYGEEKRYTFLRIPAPIYQEFINKALVNDEFKGFMRYYAQSAIPRKHLLINLQDRTSWREHVRCIALEEIQKTPEMKNVLTVVTLAIDTDFYHQLTPYHQINQAKIFKEQFKELLLDEHAGYYFPSVIKREELSQFIDQAFQTIHQIFFYSRNVMMRENRLNFIEIFYLFLQFKLIEWIQPDSISLTSKDSIDIGETSHIEIFVFLKLIHNLEWTETDWQHLNCMLYAPALLTRERIMLTDRFNRMLSMLKLIENVRDERGAENFRQIIQDECLKLFNTSILDTQILLPR